MATRRMISGDVIGRDDFIALSGDAKWLYFYCLINTDDYGLFQGMGGILRFTETTDKELQELLQSGFIKKLSDKVYVIMDFHVMNDLGGKKGDPVFPDELELLQYRKKTRYRLKDEARGDEEIDIYSNVPMTRREYDRQITKYGTPSEENIERLNNERKLRMDQV